MLNIVLPGLAFLFLLSVAFLFFQGAVSASMTPATLDATGKLPPCSDKPNCVSSAAGSADKTHYIAPIGESNLNMEDLKNIVAREGGQNIEIKGNLLTATYKSRWFGFVDDLMLLNTDEGLHVRSASRVGYSDMNVNRNRVERLRAGISPK